MNVTGKYSFDFPGPHGAPEHVLTLREGEKGALGGTFASADGKRTITLERGIVFEGMFSFYADHRGHIPAPPDGDGKLIFRCLGRIDGETLKMAVFADERDFMLSVEGRRI